MGPRSSVVHIYSGAFNVPEALGNKLIHPYPDFLLHQVGSGDNISIPAEAIVRHAD